MESCELGTLGQSAVHWRDRIAGAQAGDREALGDIFHRLRAYLRSRAVEQLDAELQVKVSPSDVVQETLLEAHRGFGTFRGGTQAELVVWVQGILNHRVQTAYRKYRGTGKRDIGRETGLHELRDARQLDELAMVQSSPSGHAMANEEHLRLESALRKLSPRHEQVIRLRNELKLPFADVAVALDCSEDAAQKLWTRAIKQLARWMKRGA